MRNRLRLPCFQALIAAVAAEFILVAALLTTLQATPVVEFVRRNGPAVQILAGVLLFLTLLCAGVIPFLCLRVRRECGKLSSKEEKTPSPFPSKKEGTMDQRRLSGEDLVIACANLLDTSEFEVFRRAREWWFGPPADERREDRELEALFSNYLKFGTVPPFVAQFARVALAKEPERRRFSHLSQSWLTRLLRSCRRA